jgi:gas vesicle protein
MNERSNNTSSPVSIINLLTGAAIGATLGVLFAPDRGVDTRRKIARTAKQYTEPITETVSHGVEDLYSKGKSMYNSVTGKKESSATNTFLITMALAVPVGVALGLLFAPDKGRKTRRMVTDTARRGAERVYSRTKKETSGKKHSE